MIREFRIEELLGKGGFAFTYRAWDTKLERNVAIKELFPKNYVMRDGRSVLPISGDKYLVEVWEKLRQNFTKEAKNLARFRSHPNIVTVVTTIEENCTSYIVMQYEQGKDLQQYLDSVKRGLGESELVPILTQILDALEQVHKSGLQHTDIKASNVYLTRERGVVLLDFGAARQEGNRSGKTTFCFKSVGFSPPEQSTSTLPITAASDIYATAATMVAAITRKPPPSADARCVKDTYVPISLRYKGRYSPSLLRGIDMGMALKAADRPQSITEWRKILFGKPSPHKAPRATLIFALFVCLVVAFTASWIAVRVGIQESASLKMGGSEQVGTSLEQVAVLTSSSQITPPPASSLPQSSPSQFAASNKKLSKVAVVPATPPNTVDGSATSMESNDLDEELNAFIKNEIEQPLHHQNYAARIVVNDSGEAGDQKEVSRDELLAEDANDEAKYIAGIGQFAHLGSKRLSYDADTDTAEMRQIFSYDRTFKSNGARRIGLVVRQVVIERAATKQRFISQRIVTARTIGYRSRLSKADHPDPAADLSQSINNEDMIRLILQRDRENVESRNHKDPEDMSFPLLRTEAARKKIARVQDNQLILIPSGDESVQQIVSGAPVVDVFPELEGPDPAIVIVVKP